LKPPRTGRFDDRGPETDAEVQRLNLLRRQHADEQFVARRNVRDLPGRIEQLTQRLNALTADLATLKAHERDPVMIGHRISGDPVAALGRQLESLPLVMHKQRVPLGMYRGLRFGLVLHPSWKPELYLEGAITRQDTLRDNAGPRAVLNALERLAGGYPADAGFTRRDVELMEKQLEDFRAKQGKGFPHETYLKNLAELRDRLRTALSGTPKEGEPSAAELAGEVKKLRSANGRSAGAAGQATGIRRGAGHGTHYTPARRW